MTVSDPVADFLTRIRNALKAEHRYTDVPFSKLKQNIAEILKQKGFIENFLVKNSGKDATIRVFLKYSKNRKPVIQGIKTVSRPGLRKYVGYKDIPFFYGGLGVPIISTSHGVLAGREAINQKAGGELLCLVW